MNPYEYKEPTETERKAAKYISDEMAKRCGWRPYFDVKRGCVMLTPAEDLVPCGDLWIPATIIPTREQCAEMEAMDRKREALQLGLRVCRIGLLLVLLFTVVMWWMHQ